MISNLWGNIELYCGNQHEEPQLMTLQQHGKQLCYMCPKCFKDNRADNELPCTNKISANDFEKMLAYIDKILTDSAMNGDEINLTNHQWKKNKLKLRILEHDKKIKVEMLNLSK